jgi:hypothetical protein
VVAKESGMRRQRDESFNVFIMNADKLVVMRSRLDDGEI